MFCKDVLLSRDFLANTGNVCQHFFTPIFDDAVWLQAISDEFLSLHKAIDKINICYAYIIANEQGKQAIVNEKTNVWQRTYTDEKGSWFHVFTNKKSVLIVEESAKFGVFVLHCSVKYAKAYIVEHLQHGFMSEGKAFELSFNQYEASPYAQKLEYWPVEFR